MTELLDALAPQTSSGQGGGRPVVLINGARVVTVSSESTDPEAIRRTIVDTGMAGLENINYLQAIKRVIGMLPMPLASP